MFSLCPFPLSWLRDYTPCLIIIIKSEVWTIIHCLGFGHETMVGAVSTVYPKKYAHGFCFAVLCCGYTLTDFPISIRLTSLALLQSNDCPSASKATLMNIDKYLMWIHYERLHNHNKAKHNKTVCIFLGIYCISIFLDMLIFLYAWLCVILQYGTLSFYQWNQRLIYFDLSFSLHSAIIDFALDRWQEIVVLILDGKQQANGLKTHTMSM